MGMKKIPGAGLAVVFGDEGVFSRQKRFLMHSDTMSSNSREALRLDLNRQLELVGVIRVNRRGSLWSFL